MDEQSDPLDAKFIPTNAVPETTTSNQASDVQNSVQASKIEGGVHLHAVAGPVEDLVSGGPTPRELAAAGEFFVPRGGRFEEARQRLARDRVVLLGGNGNGWYIAAIHLLRQHSRTDIKGVNPPRHLNRERARHLKAGFGYVWQVREPLDEFQFEAVRNAVRDAGGYLVVLVHHQDEMPDALRAELVPLVAPNSMAVAEACVRATHSMDEDKQLWVLTETFGRSLQLGASPRKAARAAELAGRIVAGDVEAEEAVQQFDEELAGAVRRWFDTGRRLTEYVVMVAVAVLEHLTSNQVFEEAEELEQAIRVAELPEDKKPRPRRVFQFSRDELLATVGAKVERREHRLYAGLTEETVRFARKDWAPALLCHAWAQYPALQPILADWLARTSFGKGVTALCTVVLGVPASDPLHFVRDFAGAPRSYKRMFAAATLSQLALEHDRRELVAETLNLWIEQRSGVWRKTTAAMVYGLPYGTREPGEALKQLERLGRAESPQQQNWVVWAVRELFRRPDNQITVLQAMCRWVYVADRTEGLRTIALSVGWALAGIDPDPDFWFPPAVGRDRLTVQRLLAALFWHVLRDEVFGARALQSMLELALSAHYDPKARERLIELFDLVLDGGSRRLAIRRLTEHHPRHRRRIRRLFRLFGLLEGRSWLAVLAGWGHGSRRVGQAA
ncbi:hypothetical protein [Kutzneria sp. NPDC051319]|uniref:hypothetical protein n=1 Tax=Kutzneria sp. NPDC051319 TaxID=3155047 RepID=UPI0034352BE2